MTSKESTKYNQWTIQELEQQIATLAVAPALSNVKLEELGRLRLHLSARRIADSLKRLREA